ncbi:MAG: hypothetical protein JW750_08780 [Anaerolineaceae bacterium]|nr:hypothetical protein [Anaerolineaceae bacterium]
MKTKILLFALIIIVLLTACSSSNTIVGKWRVVNGSDIEFFDDGSMTISDPFGTVIDGSYEYTEDNKLIINMDGLWGGSAETVMDVQLSKDAMVWTVDGQSITLEKLP